MDDFINELTDKIFFVSADKNSDFGKVQFIDNKTDETSFLSGKNAKEIIGFVGKPKNDYHHFPVEFEKKELFFVVRE